MLTLCIRFGIVPDSFVRGLLIPLLKKPNCDPSIPKNYRPIVISTTFSKLLEIIILEACSDHQFHDMQFGFVPERGTVMAAALAYDVADYMNKKGSAVYICSLDAEGAFDGIPHSVLFSKAMNIIPDIYWRMLVYWYSRLTIQIKWANNLSNNIAIKMGTRQGGLSSPFLFNVFYQEMVNQLSNTQVGVAINGTSYNVFCYADDILLYSTTISGLQTLINVANKYITEHGLRFNPDKTLCMTLGKSNFPKRQWCLNGVELKETTSLKYLGVYLSNDAKAHVNERIKATRRSFYALKSASVFAAGADIESMMYIFNTAVRPVLTYGLQCGYQCKTSMDEAEKTQCKLLKSVMRIKPICRNTPLLKAMKVRRIESDVSFQEIKLLRSLLLSSSRTRKFYTHALACHLQGTASNRNLVARAFSTCNKYNMSFISSLCDKRYSKQYFHLDDNENDGITDTIRYLSGNLDYNSRVMINAILSPFEQYSSQ